MTDIYAEQTNLYLKRYMLWVKVIRKKIFLCTFAVAPREGSVG